MSSSKRSKRSRRSVSSDDDEDEPGAWECTVCTYRNKFESFKCEICDSRKGTSTRKPRLNSSVVEKQQLAQTRAIQQQLATHTPPSFGTASTAVSTRGPRARTSVTPSSVSREASFSPSPAAAASSKKPAEPSASSPTALHSPTTTSPTNSAAPSKATKPAAQAPSPSTSTIANSIPIAPNGAKLRNVDRQSARTIPVTVNGVTIVFTDYKKKKPRKPRTTKAAKLAALPLTVDKQGDQVDGHSGLKTEIGDAIVDEDIKAEVENSGGVEHKEEGIVVDSKGIDRKS